MKEAIRTKRAGCLDLASGCDRALRRNKMTSKLKTIIFVLVTLAAYTGVASGDFAATVDTGSITWVNDPGTDGIIYGWDFTLGENIVVTHLGLYDHGNGLNDPPWPAPGDGLRRYYQVHLWRIADGTLVVPALASAIVGPSTTNLLENHRYEDVEDVELSKDYSYYVGFEYFSGEYWKFDGLILMPQSVGTANSPINILNHRFGNLSDPPTLPGYISSAYFGVNFQFTTNNPPVAEAGEDLVILSADQLLTVIHGIGTDPDDDPLTYRWLEGVEVILDWAPVGAVGEADLDLAPLPYLSLGAHTLTLEVNDGEEIASDSMVLTVENSPPEPQPAPSYQVVELGFDPIVIVADVSDFDGDNVSYQWLKAQEELDSGSVATTQGGGAVPIPDLDLPAGDPRFPLGLNQVDLVVNDGVNLPVTETVTVEVSDTTAPTLAPIPSVTMLWPPNHTLRPVTIWANAADNGGGAITLAVDVQSNEPLDGGGDGSTETDYYIDSIDNSTGEIQLRLRAERSGSGEGRVYTITITANDESSNQSVATVEIRVPHDRGKKN